MKRCKFFLLFAFFLPFSLLAADAWFEFIPENTMLILQVHPDRISKSDPYKIIAESGDIQDIRDNLSVYPWKHDKSLPEINIIYSRDTPDTFAILLQTEYTADEMYAFLLEKYKNVPNTTVTRKPLPGHDLMEVLTTFPKRPGKFRKTSILYLAPHVAAFAAHHQTLPANSFRGKFIPAEETSKLRENNGENVAFGILRPVSMAALGDPTGLSNYVTDGHFSAGENKAGVASCDILLNCKDLQSAASAAKRLQSFTRIMLVSFCAADKTLFKKLNEVIKIEQNDKTVKMHAALSPDLLSQIRSYYQNNSKAVLISLESQLQNKKTAK